MNTYLTPIRHNLQTTHNIQLSTLIQRTGILPAADIAVAVNDALIHHSSLVITAPPGAGKSTLLPLTMLSAMTTSGKILMLEPRRLAARHIAERMANLLGEPVGQTIGYRVRFESKVSKATRIEVITEGILTRMLIDDATLEGVDMVIFDEFHERSIQVDLALALARQAQQIIRDDLKLVVMSATLQADAICKALQAPLIQSKGRMFPVEVFHADTSVHDIDLCNLVVDTIRQVHQKYMGDILVFLPGQAEIATCMNRLGTSLRPTQVYSLYGNLSPEQQRAAIAPSAKGERKVVLATPIAETSVTIEGVRIVIDSGLCRKQVIDTRTGLSHLETVRISKDMATQRTGRAGRVANGICFRLWPLAIEHQMKEQRVPEILETDLATTLLSVTAFGENDIMNLAWLTPPPKAHVANAQQLLRLLGAIDSKGCISSLGKRMALMPCHPRIARMMLGASGHEMKALACDIAAIIEEKDPLIENKDADLTLRISRLRQCRRLHNLGQWKRIAQIAQEYRRMLRIEEDNADPAPEQVGLLVAYAYPERIAMATNAIGHYRLATGGNACVDNANIIASYQWIAIASLHAAPNAMGRIFLAAPICVDNLDSSFITTRHHLSWNTKQGGIIAQSEERIGQLTIRSTPLHTLDKDMVITAICEAAKKDGLSMFNWSEAVKQLQLRISKVAEWHPELHIPDVCTSQLLSTAQAWLPFYLEQGGKLKTTIDELKRIDLCEVIWAMIPYELQSDIERLAPTHIKVPTGSNIRIDYRPGADAPILSVRLQECFGLQDTPCVNAGKQPILMELLSPGFKPVQLTQDLRNFWDSTYFEVRKELRRRYPKHYWPENPIEAEAVKGVRRKK